jgi:hypothetical protein
LMEKRVAAVIRWLERCVIAYKGGAVESALMDAECAKADIETLRNDLWKAVEGRRRADARRFLRPAEALFWAVVIMLVTAAPLAQPQALSAMEDRSDGYFTLEWVTPDEKELLGNVRRRPSEELALVVKPEEDQVAAPLALPARVTEPARRRTPEPQPPRSEQNKETNIPYDRILSLIETGERAMKNDAPAIRLENVK